MIVGIVCVAFNIIMYTAPLTVMVLTPKLLYQFIIIIIITSVLIQQELDFLVPHLFTNHVHLFFSPFEQRLVIRTKSVKYMPFGLSLCNFLNGLIWLVYALLKFDPYILVNLHFLLFQLNLFRVWLLTFFRNFCALQIIFRDIFL